MKGFTIVCLAIALLASASVSWAHPPKDVKLDFDQDSHMLMVTAIHDTKDVTKHYVGDIEVDLNGEKMIDQKFKSQPMADMQMGHYLINDAKIGDTIAVTATCNIAGKKTVTLKLEKPKPAAPATPATQGQGK